MCYEYLLSEIIKDGGLVSFTPQHGAPSCSQSALTASLSRHRCPKKSEKGYRRD